MLAREGVQTGIVTNADRKETPVLARSRTAGIVASSSAPWSSVKIITMFRKFAASPKWFGEVLSKVEAHNFCYQDLLMIDRDK